MVEEEKMREVVVVVVVPWELAASRLEEALETLGLSDALWLQGHPVAPVPAAASRHGSHRQDRLCARLNCFLDLHQHGSRGIGVY